MMKWSQLAALLVTSLLSTGAAADYDTFKVPALLPPEGMASDAQLRVFKSCKEDAFSSKSAEKGLTNEERAQLNRVVSQDFFSNGQPVIGEMWVPAATLNRDRGHDTPGVSQSVSDAFVVCFLRAGYSSGTFLQRLKHK